MLRDKVKPVEERNRMARRSDLELEIQQRMIQMIAQVVLFNHAANASLGLGASDSQFLTLLRTRGPMTPGQLAVATGLTSGTVTGVIDRLEKASLVRRDRDATDRRKVLVVPMADAVDRLAPIYAGQGAMLQRVLRRRSSGELEVISGFLGDLVIEDDGNLSSPEVPDDAR
jgi:DNA-binding MarR family transcriptional regulator